MVLNHKSNVLILPNLSYECCDIDHIVMDIKHHPLRHIDHNTDHIHVENASFHRPLSFEAAVWLRLNNIKNSYVGVFDTQELELYIKLNE
jgi:hypothetical protein